MSKPTRRESRETAFSLLFEWSFKEESLDEIIEMAAEAGNANDDAFARELAEKAIDNKDEIDSLIERYSQGRRLSRISKTVLAVLRLCFCELTQFKDIPAGASINEGVELLKKYATEEEASYLNGILGRFERVRKGLEPAPPVKETSNSNTDDEQNTHNSDNSSKEINEKPRYNTEDVELIDDIKIEVE